jgi:hypothetical protein
VVLECESLSERSGDPAPRGFRGFYVSAGNPIPARTKIIGKLAKVKQNFVQKKKKAATIQRWG